MLETHLAGKTTEKRQNFDPSTPPAGAENLHFTLNGETRRAPGPPVTHARELRKTWTSFVLLYVSPLMRQLQNNI
jgi:hypothetical protein